MKFNFLKSLLATCMLVFFTNTKAQTFSWAQCSSTPSASIDKGTAVYSDPQGNVVVTGSFDSQMLVFGTYSLTNPNGGYMMNGNVFVTKYDKNGNLLWAIQSIGNATANDDYATSVSSDPAGNIYVGGYFIGATITFGPYMLINPNCPLACTYAPFLVKIDPAGNVLWAYTNPLFPALGQINSVSAVSGGSLFVTGSFYSPTITFGTYTLTNTGPGNNMFIVEFDFNGNVLRAASAGGSAGSGVGEEGNSVVFDAANNAVYVAGYYTSPSAAFGTYTLTNPGTGFRTFLTKYNASTGAVVWAKDAGGSSSYPAGTICRSACVDASGNVYLAGFFNEASAAFGAYTLTNAGDKDAFVAKYNSSGTELWAKNFGGTSRETGNSISSHAGGIYVTGGFDSPSMLIGSTTFTPPAPFPTGPPADPSYIVSFDPNGNLICGNILGSGGGGTGSSGLERFSTVVATDNFSGKACLGGDWGNAPFVIGTNTLTQTSVRTIFATKYNCSALGMTEDKISPEPELFPNPSGGAFTLKLTENIENGVMIVTNTLGQMVLKQPVSRGETFVNLKGIAKGLYYYSVVSNDKSLQNGKLIIE